MIEERKKIKIGIKTEVELKMVTSECVCLVVRWGGISRLDAVF